MEYWDKKKLREVIKRRQIRTAAQPLSKSVDAFLRRKVIPRQKKLMVLGEAWIELLPPVLQEHSCLENFNRGQLRVLVDNSTYLAELNMMVREGLTEQLREMCPNVPLSKIKLVYGQWYHTDEEGNKIADF